MLDRHVGIHHDHAISLDGDGKRLDGGSPVADRREGGGALRGSDGACARGRCDERGRKERLILLGGGIDRLAGVCLRGELGDRGGGGARDRHGGIRGAGHAMRQTGEGVDGGLQRRQGGALASAERNGDLIHQALACDANLSASGLLSVGGRLLHLKLGVSIGGAAEVARVARVADEVAHCVLVAATLAGAHAREVGATDLLMSAVETAADVLAVLVVLLDAKPLDLADDPIVLLDEMLALATDLRGGRDLLRELREAGLHALDLGAAVAAHGAHVAGLVIDAAHALEHGGRGDARDHCRVGARGGRGGRLLREHGHDRRGPELRDRGRRRLRGGPLGGRRLAGGKAGGARGRGRTRLAGGKRRRSGSGVRGSGVRVARLGTRGGVELVEHGGVPRVVGPLVARADLGAARVLVSELGAIPLATEAGRGVGAPELGALPVGPEGPVSEVAAPLGEGPLRPKPGLPVPGAELGARPVAHEKRIAPELDGDFLDDAGGASADARKHRVHVARGAVDQVAARCEPGTGRAVLEGCATAESIRPGAPLVVASGPVAEDLDDRTDLHVRLIVAIDVGEKGPEITSVARGALGTVGLDAPRVAEGVADPAAVVNGVDRADAIGEPIERLVQRRGLADAEVLRAFHALDRRHRHHQPFRFRAYPT